MTFIVLFFLAVLLLAVLAPLVGADSRGLADSDEQGRDKLWSRRP